MQIKWLRKAIKSLDEEANYIAKNNPKAARLMVRRIVQTVSFLSQNPALGHPARLPGTYELVIPKTSYLVPYRISPMLEQVEILRVFHSLRKQPAQW